MLKIHKSNKNVESQTFLFYRNQPCWEQKKFWEEKYVKEAELRVYDYKKPVVLMCERCVTPLPAMMGVGSEVKLEILVGIIYN